MKEKDWKLHASKTLARKLKPLRNCTALRSGGSRRSRQSSELPTSELIILDPLLEQWQSTAGTHPGAFLPTQKHAATSTHFWKRNFSSPERNQNPSQPVSWLHKQQQLQLLDGMSQSWTCSVRNPGLHCRHVPPPDLLVLQLQVNTPPHTLAFLFSSVKQRCYVVKYNQFYLHKLLGYSWMKSPVLNWQKYN